MNSTTSSTKAEAQRVGAQEPRYGATPEEWAHFADRLELVDDLLPVVSNPRAVVSPRSKIAGIGKTPSRYNAQRQVVGIPAWTGLHTSAVEVGRWQRDPDFGICLQTRRVRALDIDIDDPALSAEVRSTVELLAGALPVRARAGSGKCLLAFRLEGEWSKRVLRTALGAVEFLAAGQQFVAAGTHPSGVRYEWLGGLPTDIPYLSAAEFDALWHALVERFALSATVGRPRGKQGTARHAADVAPNDAVLGYLERTGWIQILDSQGRAHITCPWEHEHTAGGQGDTSTTYFPPGVGGFAQGHFRCLHAHCEGRTDGDFLEAIGYASEGFEVVAVPEGQPEPVALPPFERDRSGSILATVANLEMALRRSDVAGVQIGFDSFRDELMIAEHGTQGWRAFADADYVRLRIRLENGGFKVIGREIMRDVVTLVGEEQRFDSAQLWLSGLRWDGVPRVDTFLERYFSAASGAYSRSVSRYIWTAMAGRVLEPGCKADMVPILVGEQGVGKSTGIAAMVPGPEHYLELRLDEPEIEIARRMRGKLIAEIGELRGMASREIEHIKAFVTRTHEEWVPKYKEFSVTFARRLLFMGTTNNDEFLADETGNRRWLPERVGQVDVAGIARDRDQLWAEGVALFTAHGVAWDMAQQLAVDVHEDHLISDPWEDAVDRWLDALSVTGGKNRDGLIRISDLLQEGLGIDVRHQSRKDELRVGRILRSRGLRKTRTREGGQRFKVWGTDCAISQGKLAFLYAQDGEGNEPIPF